MISDGLKLLATKVRLRDKEYGKRKKRTLAWTLWLDVLDPSGEHFHHLL